MQTLTIPGIDQPVSLISQGSLGLLWADDANAFAVLDAAMEAGICSFDTAHVYDFDGRGVDRLLGRWIRSHGERERAVIMAKGCHPDTEGNPRVTPSALAQDVSDTLRRSELGYVDIWSFHRDDPTVPVGELVDAANAEIDAGHIRAWGVSNWTTNRLDAALDFAAANGRSGPVANSAHYSLVDQVAPPWDDVVTLTGESAADDRAWHEANQLPVVAWSSLAGGFLSANLSRQQIDSPENAGVAETARCYSTPTNWARRERAEALAADRGVSLSQLAVAWVLGDPMATLAITGGATIDEVRENAVAASIVLDTEDRTMLSEGAST